MPSYVPIRLAYKTFEPSEESNEKLAPVIFLHGATCSKEMWGDIPQIIANRTKRKTYAYDARSHGESESAKHFNFDLNVDDLFHFMDGLNIERAVLVGHSMGSLTATNAALRMPERFEVIFSEDMYIKKLSKKVASSVVKYISSLSRAVQSVPKHLNESDAFLEAVEILFKNSEESVAFTSREAVKSSKRLLKRKEDGGYDVAFDKDALIRAFKDPETLMSIPNGQFNGPIYFLYGGNSPFSVGSEEAQIKRHFPRAEFIEFKGASHSLHLEFQDKFVEVILSRLQR